MVFVVVLIKWFCFVFVVVVVLINWCSDYQLSKKSILPKWLSTYLFFNLLNLTSEYMDNTQKNNIMESMRINLDWVSNALSGKNERDKSNEDKPRLGQQCIIWKK